MRSRTDVGLIGSIVILVIWAVVALGVLAFWGLVIYALYLLVTGQLHLG